MSVLSGSSLHLSVGMLDSGEWDTLTPSPPSSFLSEYSSLRRECINETYFLFESIHRRASLIASFFPPRSPLPEANGVIYRCAIQSGKLFVTDKLFEEESGVGLEGKEKISFSLFLLHYLLMSSTSFSTQSTIKHAITHFERIYESLDLRQSFC